MPTVWQDYQAAYDLKLRSDHTWELLAKVRKAAPPGGIYPCSVIKKFYLSVADLMSLVMARAAELNTGSARIVWNALIDSLGPELRSGDITEEVLTLSDFTRTQFLVKYTRLCREARLAGKADISAPDLGKDFIAVIDKIGVVSRHLGELAETQPFFLNWWGSNAVANSIVGIYNAEMAVVASAKAVVKGTQDLVSGASSALDSIMGLFSPTIWIVGGVGAFVAWQLLKGKKNARR